MRTGIKSRIQVQFLKFPMSRRLNLRDEGVLRVQLRTEGVCAQSPALAGEGEGTWKGTKKGEGRKWINGEWGTGNGEWARAIKWQRVPVRVCVWVWVWVRVREDLDANAASVLKPISVRFG